jgi:hypothetical protein
VGQFHALEVGIEGEVDDTRMTRAVTAETWYLGVARRLIGVTYRPQAVVDAELLLDWLLRQPTSTIEPRRMWFEHALVAATRTSRP